MPYTDDLTDVEAQKCADAIRDGHTRTFASRTNRDKVWKLLPASTKAMCYRRSSTNQLYDPRYTVEGSIAGLVDQGFANDYKHFHPHLYMIERKRY